ncbi:MAG: DUF1844 domain-containing protein [Desulfobacterium sp.]|jgi:hypothetical protein|nr:DUF1844 domain-containing protein [Desulfobacterium sp.]
MTDQTKDFIVKDTEISSSEDTSDKKKENAAGSSTSGEHSGQDPQLPKINFSTFIFSLNSSALYHLGLVPDPTTGKKEKNLLLAKQSIDILGMLDEKTHGNLTNDEEKLLRHILHDLRLMYVKERN